MSGDPKIRHSRRRLTVPGNRANERHNRSRVFPGMPQTEIVSGPSAQFSGFDFGIWIEEWEEVWSLPFLRFSNCVRR